MIKVLSFSTVAVLTLGACSSTPLNTALGTPKNPAGVFVNPKPPKDQRGSDKYSPKNQIEFVLPLYDVLRAPARDGTLLTSPISEDPMRRYLAAGFALSDIYCANYFAKSDESYRRRKFGRGVTNDVGTVVSTILGLAKVNANIVSGFASGFGLADSSWRNYDDSFLISPDLSNVQGLVFAAQDNYRATTLGKDTKGNNVPLPADYMTAQSVILRYANICSYLGMKSLLNRSADEQRTQLNKDSDVKNGVAKNDPGAGTSKPADTSSPPAAATPQMSPNR